MATSEEIAIVRRNTNEPTTTTYQDSEVSEYIDNAGTSGASSIIWRQKAATFQTMVDTSEAGASRKFSDLMKNALAMAESYEPKADGSTPVGTTPRAKVHKIVRS